MVDVDGENEGDMMVGLWQREIMRSASEGDSGGCEMAIKELRWT